MKVTWRSRQTACIHGTELLWRRSFMVRSWWDCVKSWYGVDAIWYAAGVIPQSHSKWFLCTLYSSLYSRIHLADFLLVLARKKSANSPYGVKKISRKWLWPVKVTLEIIKRRPKVFCWSCDDDPLKWDKKKLPSLQFAITDRMSLLSPLNLNGRSIPLRSPGIDSVGLCSPSDPPGWESIPGWHRNHWFRRYRCQRYRRQN
jgi:hypothetical protein